LEFVKTEYDGESVSGYIYLCATCGPFHFTDTKPLTPGMPE
jgi:hypothetical protein